MADLAGKDEPNQEPPHLREAGAVGFEEVVVLVFRWWASFLASQGAHVGAGMDCETGSGQVNRNLG